MSFRQYSITNSNDLNHIENGRCPDYALYWDTVSNSKHWATEHDYFVGNGHDIDEESLHFREILSRRYQAGLGDVPIVFCDLDGVLADFEQGIINVTQKTSKELRPSFMWSMIHSSVDFFENLPWMPKGRDLWTQIRRYNPIILTGVPSSNKQITEQKMRWCARELGPDVEVITCASKNKSHYCLRGSILIDDRPDNMKPWTLKDGKFVLYEESKLEEVVDTINNLMHDA